MKKLNFIIMVFVILILPVAVMAETDGQPAEILGETYAVNAELTEETPVPPTVIEFFSEAPTHTDNSPAEATETPSETPSESPELTPDAETATPTATATETPTPTDAPTPTENVAEQPEETAEIIAALEETVNYNDEKNLATITDIPAKKKRTKLTEEDFRITYGSVTVSLGDTPAEIIEEMSKDEYPPCTIQEDRITIITPASKAYENDEISIMTNLNEAGNAEIINALFVGTPGIKTARGVGIGDSVATMKKRYGKPAQSQGDTVLYYVETADGYQSIIFQIEDRDDTVFSYALLNMYPKSYKLPNE